MNGIDLPEPVRPTLTDAEKEERALRLFTTLFLFISAYSFLHKVLIPFCLSFTKLHPSPYTVVDPWFIHPVLLALLFKKEKGNSNIVSLLAGAAVTYGILEFIEVLQGHYIGWLSFSRLLSSTPMALLSLFMMTRQSVKRNALLGWTGALIILPFYYGKILFPAASAIVENLKPKTVVTEAPRSLPTQEIAVCGAKTLSLTKNTTQFHTSDFIEVKECGITPSFILLKGTELQLRNSGKVPLNLHLGYFKNGKISTGWNVLLPPQQAVRREVKIPENSVAVIYSDSVTEAGITAITQHPPTSNWEIVRTPLTIREIP